MKRSDAQSGQGYAHPVTGHVLIAMPTMSSLAMVDYINAERRAKAEAEGLTFPCRKYRRLKHKNFMAKVPKVLGENHSAKFLAQYKDSTGRDLPCYNFPKREACLMAMSYSYELQAAVYDYMEELEHQKGVYLGYTISELQNIVASARQYSDDDSSDAGKRLRKRQGDLVLLEKAEALVSSLGQLSLSLPGEND
ncbi:TPA: Rha family transcriptional regulator [Salmonella enterica]|uniref:Rha family transcriptional regulator n=1 Tax=Salmonella enterica TaxID=28901 RepID=A0A759YKG0_SALER|nr:Rha family transcriptional regulator [Salmonella enterica]